MKKEENQAHDVDYSAQNIVDVEIVHEMKKSYIDYSMSVIVGRALPDARDGFKPVHRRILYAMHEAGLTPERPYRKCATTVGDVLGKYHPHGDASVYDALVRMAQDFSLRYPLVDGQGNFGTIDGDPPAAYRYTEARMEKIAGEMITDIEKNTVDFIPNFDESLKEPSVLPSRFPNMLVNGSSGIAVGMATNMPPHNLTEVINGIVATIDNPEITIDELMEYIKGPDFPTYGIILGKTGIRNAYRTGRGKIYMRARCEIQETNGDRQQIVVTELPYQVNKARLVEKIAELVKDKRVDGIVDIRDETSDRAGMRIVIKLRKDVNAAVLLNQLYKYTSLQETFSVINLALVNNEPKVLNLRQLIDVYIDFQEQVIKRRTKYNLEKAQARAHILEGLKIALDNIDEIIKIIRSSYDNAKANLMERFGFSDLQAQAILDMRLARLQGLEKEKIEAELAELMEKIKYYQEILSNEQMVFDIIKEELIVIKEKYGDERRTEIGINMDEIDDEDLIEEEESVITMTHYGYVKRIPLATYKSQHRGGRGITGLSTREEDVVEKIFTASTHDYLMFFTNQGRTYKIKVYQIPESGRTAKGTAAINVIPLEADEKITATIPLREFKEDQYLIMMTKRGFVKKTPLSAYDTNRKGGLIAIGLREDDELIEVKLTGGDDNIILGTKHGMCIKFNENDVRAMGRGASGVTGIRLKGDDYVIGGGISSTGEEKLLTVTENGYGKKTQITEFKCQTRGGKGVTGYKLTDKTGLVAGISVINGGDDLMIITSEGIIIRMSTDEISEFGRVTQGVRVMRTGDDIKIVSIAKTDKEEEEEVIEEVTEETKKSDE